MSSIGVIISFTLLGYILAQDPNCDYFQNVEPGQTYYVYSPNYPESYKPGVQCRWTAACPSGYNCKLECNLIDLPESQSCSMDRLLISKSGDSQLSGAQYYCGKGSVTAVSTGQRIVVGLIISYQSLGGSFLCQLTAQPASTNPEQCRCGLKKGLRIVGGNETGVNEYPMMAGLVDVDIFQIKCGAVIIDKRYVLTAAHCVVNLAVNKAAVIVGEHDVTIGDSPATQGLRVSRFIVHPQYSDNNYDYDIAVVELARDIQYSDRVGPVCLPFKFTDYSFAGQKVTALGWGTLFPGGQTSNVLRKVDIDVISQDRCRQTVSDLTARQICTFTLGKDTCQDDSGGPLLYTDPRTGLLFNAGIVSYGRFCASPDQPGVNTRVTALLNWIQGVTPNVNYCVK